MAKQYLDKTGLTYFWGKLKDYFQVKLVSGTNIKTINSESLLGSGNIDIGGGTVGEDYVVEAGVAGIWRWRKWESGTSECWCTWSGTVASYTTVLGGYGFYKDVNFLTGMFNVAPKPFFTANVGSGFGLASSVMNLTATSGRFFIIGNTSGSQTITIYLYLIGTWK